MILLESQSAAPKPNRRWFRYSRCKLLVFLALFAIFCTWFTLRNLGYDYDKARYTQIVEAVAADEYRRGKPFDEVVTELGLEEVPWDMGFGQGGEDRIYHFRGFALYLTLVDWPPIGASSGGDLRRDTVRWIRPHPFACVDGINDPKERMKQYWKVCDEECARINAERTKERQRNGR